jgi:nucleoside-diphosphate-sugar epimerase
MITTEHRGPHAPAGFLGNEAVASSEDRTASKETGLSTLPTPVRAMREAPRRTLLVGCGKLGTRLGQRLVETGGEVFALRRNAAALPAAFAALPVDLRAPVHRDLPTVDAMVVTLPPDGQGGSDQPDDYLASLKNLAAALPSTPRRVVFVSSTRVFEGRTDRRALTEADTPAPVTPRGQTLHNGELLASELFDAHIVRPAGIYGLGREMLLRKVVEGTPVQYAKRTNRIHETDLVSALEVLLFAGDPPRILHAVDRAPAPLGEVVTYIAHQLRLPPPPRIQPDEATGIVLSGARLLTLLGPLQYPTFQAGYDHIIATRDHQASPMPDQQAAP